jgi:hypothetical protein
MSEVDTIENDPEKDLEKYSFPHSPESKKTYSRNSKKHFSSVKANKVHTENHAISSSDINWTTEEHKISLDYSGCENTMIPNPLENISFEKEFSEKNGTEEVTFELTNNDRGCRKVSESERRSFEGDGLASIPTKILVSNCPLSTPSSNGPIDVKIKKEIFDD